ncbi:hypothetical protein AFK68_31760 [Hydrocoleum sp. CS-953]|nr:hypothetical protein AFK68_31760 [Hydrocoleum sp. CS-953]
MRGGSTCIVNEINWETKQIELSPIFSKSDRYKLFSNSYSNRNQEQIFPNATLDESPSDFVAGRVDDKLQNTQGNHVCRWLAPENPQIPLQISPSENDL